MKKILMLNYEYPPLGGGASRVTESILYQLKNNKNLEIDLVTSSTDMFRIEDFSNHIKIHFLDINKKGKNQFYQSNKELLVYSFKAYKYIKKIIKQKQFDFIHAFFGIPCGYIAMKLKLPYIISLQGSDVPFYNKRFRMLDILFFRRLSKKIWKKSFCVTSNSKGLKELALKTLPDFDIKLIYNGVNIDKFIQKKYQKNYKIIKLISTGRLIKRKGYDYLIKALHGLKEFKLILIGAGNIQDELEQLANDLNVDVEFKGMINHTEIINYLQESDIFILPSLNEGMSISLLEAISCGLPCIVTDVGGSGELVIDNGFVVEKGSVEQLRDALIKYKNNKKLIEIHGKKSREIAKKMSWENIIKEYLDLYNKIKT